MKGAKPVLGISQVEVLGQVRKEESLKDLSHRREERDGPVGCAFISWLARFEDGRNVGSFPYSWDAGGRDREIENLNQVCNGQRAKIAEVEDG